MLHNENELWKQTLNVFDWVTVCFSCSIDLSILHLKRLDPLIHGVPIHTRVVHPSLNAMLVQRMKVGAEGEVHVLKQDLSLNGVVEVVDCRTVGYVGLHSGGNCCLEPVHSL